MFSAHLLACTPTQAAARAAGLQACLTPGLLAASLFPALIGSRLVCFPCLCFCTHGAESYTLHTSQPGALYLTQSLSFRSAAPVGVRLHASVRAQRVTGRRALFDTRCVLDGTDTVVLDGIALALLPAS